MPKTPPIETTSVTAPPTEAVTRTGSAGRLPRWEVRLPNHPGAVIVEAIDEPSAFAAFKLQVGLIDTGWVPQIQRVEP